MHKSRVELYLASGHSRNVRDVRIFPVRDPLGAGQLSRISGRDPMTGSGWIRTLATLATIAGFAPGPAVDDDDSAVQQSKGGGQ